MVASEVYVSSSCPISLFHLPLPPQTSGVLVTDRFELGVFVPVSPEIVMVECLSKCRLTVIVNEIVL